MVRCVVCTVALVAAWPTRAGAQGGIDGVAWMQGCWQMTSGDRVIEETWTAPRGGVMLGSGRTVRAGKLVEHEFVLLAERDGRLAYEAHPSSQPPTTFMSKEIDPHRLCSRTRRTISHSGSDIGAWPATACWRGSKGPCPATPAVRSFPINESTARAERAAHVGGGA